MVISAPPKPTTEAAQRGRVVRRHPVGPLGEHGADRADHHRHRQHSHRPLGRGTAAGQGREQRERGNRSEGHHGRRHHGSGADGEAGPEKVGAAEQNCVRGDGDRGEGVHHVVARPEPQLGHHRRRLVQAGDQGGSNEHRRGRDQEQEGSCGAVRDRPDPGGHQLEPPAQPAGADAHAEGAGDTGDQHGAEDRPAEAGAGGLLGGEHAGDHRDHDVDAGQDRGRQRDGAVVVHRLGGDAGPAAEAEEHDGEHRGHGQRHDPEGYAGGRQLRPVADQPHVGPDPERVGGLPVGAGVGEEPADDGEPHEGHQRGARGSHGGDRRGHGERAALGLTRRRWPGPAPEQLGGEQAGQPAPGTLGRARGGRAVQQISHCRPILSQEGDQPREARGLASV